MSLRIRITDACGSEQSHRNGGQHETFHRCCPSRVRVTVVHLELGPIPAQRPDECAGGYRPFVPKCHLQTTNCPEVRSPGSGERGPSSCASSRATATSRWRRSPPTPTPAPPRVGGA